LNYENFQNVDFERFRKACAGLTGEQLHLVREREYIPEPVNRTPMELNLKYLILPEKFRNEIAETLFTETERKTTHANVVAELMRRDDIYTFIRNDLELEQVCHMVRELIKSLPAERNGRLHFLTAEAGSGKTVALTSLAGALQQEHAVLFLSGYNMASTSKTLLEYLESAIVERLPGDSEPEDARSGGSIRSAGFRDFLVSTRTAGKTFILFFDGIDQHRDPGWVSSGIAELLEFSRGYPAVIITSARMNNSELFDTEKWPASQWNEIELSQLDDWWESELGFESDNPSDPEVNLWMEYDVQEPALRHIFNETIREQSRSDRFPSGYIFSMRWPAVFDLYLDRKRRSIARLSRGKTDPSDVVDFLTALADLMRTERTDEIGHTVVQDTAEAVRPGKGGKILSAAIGENLLNETSIRDRAFKTVEVIAFAQSMLMEYLIARSIFEQLNPSDRVLMETVLRGIIAEVDGWQPMSGVLEFLLGNIREEFGIVPWSEFELVPGPADEAVCSIITHLPRNAIGEREISLLDKLTRSGYWFARYHSVAFLRRIAEGYADNDRLLKFCLQILLRVLSEEKNVNIRLEVLKWFAESEAASGYQAGADAVSWWKTARKKVKGSKILMTDDDDTFLEVLEMFFQEFGLQCFTESDTREVIPLAERCTPDLIITDSMHMHFRNFELARRIVDNPLLSSTLIILLSGSKHFQRMHKDDMIGEFDDLFHGLVRRPFKPKDLLEFVETALAGRYPQTAAHETP